jgi:cyclopropane fatty-acyl-phospholipid synthase-like methyltransferase
LKLAAWIYYLLDRRIGAPSRFERLYAFDKDPFGCETYAYEQEKFLTIVNELGNHQYSHILDIGCGAGTLTRMLASNALKITAIDFSPKAIKHAKSHPSSANNILYQCHDIRNLSLTESYDIIICSEVLYYLAPEEIDRFCRLLSQFQQKGTPIVTIGKVHDETVSSVLSKHFYISKKIESHQNRRPYAITFYEIR